MHTVYTPSEEEREQLRQPRGTVVDDEPLANHLRHRSYHRLIAVGDRVSRDLVDGGITPDIAIVDGKIQREPVETTPHIDAGVDVEAANPPGQVTREAWTAVRDAVARPCPSRITVEGEEDLLALPAALYAAPASVVVYGQRDRGAVILDAGATRGFVEQLVGRRTYDRVMVGGTWDRLHAGHRSLLLAAFERGHHVDIGVTTDAYHPDDAPVQPFADRRAGVERMVDRFGVRDRATLTGIDDYQGTAVDRGDAVVATPETVAGARRINADRTAAGNPPIDIITVPLVRGVDGDPVSSSRIRAGEIDRAGRPVNS